MNRFRPFSGRSRTLQENDTRSQNTTNDSMLKRVLRGSGSNSNNEDIRLEEIVDIESDITRFSTQQAYMIDPRQLYAHNRFLRDTSLFSRYQEVTLSVADEEVETIDVISQESIRQLLLTNKRYFHLGLFIIGIAIFIK